MNIYNGTKSCLGWNSERWHADSGWVKDFWDNEKLRQKIASLEAELAHYKPDASLSAYLAPSYMQLLNENKELREKLAKHEPGRLLPCPFCGSDVSEPFVEHQPMGHENWWVLCDKCGCDVNAQPSRDEAIKAWNTRVK